MTLPAPENIRNFSDLSGQIQREPEVFATGGHGDLYLGTLNRSGRSSLKVAVKSIRGWNAIKEAPTIPKDKLEERLKREATVWHRISTDKSSKNILGFLGIWYDDKGCPCFVSPYLEFGHVMEYLEKHPGVDKMAIIRGIASGVAYLHSRPEGVIHGDLKPTNILIDDNGVAQLCDFGRGKIIGHQGYTTATPGAYRYTAPELSDDPEDANIPAPKLSFKTDVFSISLVIFEVASGQMPMSRLNDYQAMVSIAKGNRPKREQDMATLLPDNLWGLIGKCWRQNPSERPEAHQVVQELSRMGSLTA